MLKILFLATAGILIQIQSTLGIPGTCLEPPDRGNCTGHQILYYYSPEHENCLEFDFSACPQNENNFNTIQDCLDKCTTPRTSISNSTSDEESYDDEDQEQENSSRLALITSEEHEDHSTDTEHNNVEDLELKLPLKKIEDSDESSDSEYLMIENGTGQTTFTFSSPSAFMQIGEDISKYQIRNRRSVELEFRTRQPHALLVYHGLKINEKASTKIMNKYELYVMLDQGMLKVKHLFGDFSTTFVVAKGLKNDKWHKVQVIIDPHEGIIMASVDDIENSKEIVGLKHFPLYGAEHEQDLDSIIYFGGMQKSGPLEVSYLANTFIGCIRNIVLSTSSIVSDPLEPIVPLISRVGNYNVQENCLNKCSGKDIPCARDAKCINFYDHIRCDCFESRFKGEKCKNTNISMLTLNGYSYVTFTVYEWTDRVHSDSNRISMHFKTYADDTILFYGAGENPYHNHIAASLKDRRVYVNIDLGDGEPIETHIGHNLNDGDWHVLTVIHAGKNIEIRLEDEKKRSRHRPQHFEIKGKHHHLYIDPDIYIGGGGPILKDREGLNSSNNFVGCLKEVYFNEKSILFELEQKSHQARHHGLTPIFGHCNPQKGVPITIPFSESGFRISNPNETELNLRFDFKTDVVFGTIAYAEIRTIKGEGFWELKIVNDELRFVIQADRNLASINTPKPLVAKYHKNPDAWSTVHLKYSKGAVRLVTQRSNETETYHDLFLVLSQFITLGTSMYKPHTGFVGCMRKVHVGGEYVDARSVVGSEDQIGDISLDNCQFVNPCLRPNVCEHGGKCSVQGGDVTCECSETGYIGKHCHFAIFKRTCEELALLGYKESGVYKIDIDGNGIFPPSNVKCKFSDETGETKTIVEHNLHNETDIWSPDDDNQDFKLELTYREFTPEMLLSLVSESVNCNQYIKYDCFKSNLALSNQYTWFDSADPKAYPVISIGNAPRGRCPCSESNTCNSKSLTCNCDSMEEKWLSDEGFFSDPQRLGIVGMQFLVPKDLPRNAASRITLGPLECVEANTQRYVVTFKTFGSYLEAPGWKSGDLAFSFRTTRSSAILLYQPSHRHHNSFSVFLSNDHELIFRFILRSGEPQVVVVRSQRTLSGGDWQQVWIDYDLHQVRFQINAEHQMITLPDAGIFGPFEGTMYIAGAPGKYLNSNDTAVKDGLIGCFRGLVMNGQVLDLYSYMKFHKADIVKDCSPSCDPNPCKNSAQCIENWGSFTCQCVNPWAHSGQLCETDLNVDGLTFLSQSSFIKIASTGDSDDGIPIKNILSSNIFLNLRTYDENALVLYANDNLNNFVQIHISGGNTVIFTWNEGSRIHTLTVMYKGLNRGDSVQIAVQRLENQTVLHVNQVNESLDVGVDLLSVYHEHPWENPEDELFTPPRPFAPIYSYHQLFLGGYDNINALKPVRRDNDIPGMLGCLRGLKVGHDQIYLSKMANQNDVLEGCKMVCDSKPCLNGGFCLEDFQTRTYSCNCTYTSYYGQNCNEERGASFQGESFIRRRFKTIEKSVQEIEVRFGFSLSYAEVETVLLTVQIPDQNYSLFFALNRHGHLMIREERNSLELHGATINYQNFVDGSRHSIYFRRDYDETLFLVDHDEIHIKSMVLEQKNEEFPATFQGLNNSLENMIVDTNSNVKNVFIGEIFIAGVNEAVPKLRDYKRFKGCMSNIFVQIYDVKMLPVEEYMGFVKKDPDLVLEVDKIEGIKLGNCAGFLPMMAQIIVPPSDQVVSEETEINQWISTVPKRKPLTLRRSEEVKTSGMSFNTMAAIFAAFLGTVILAVLLYLYRLNKKYLRRKLETYSDDDLYFTHRGQTVYPSNTPTELQYMSLKPKNPANDSEKVVLLSNNSLDPPQNHNNNRNQSQKNSLNVGGGVDDENVESSSDTESNSPPRSTASSELSHSVNLNNTNHLIDKGKYTNAGHRERKKKKKFSQKVSKSDRDGKVKLAENDGDINKSTIPNTDPDNPNMIKKNKTSNLPSTTTLTTPSTSTSTSTGNTRPFLPIFISNYCRTIEQSPIARISGNCYQPKQRKRSKDSIISLD